MKIPASPNFQQKGCFLTINVSCVVFMAFLLTGPLKYIGIKLFPTDTKSNLADSGIKSSGWTGNCTKNFQKRQIFLDFLLLWIFVRKIYSRDKREKKYVVGKETKGWWVDKGSMAGL
ncbi:MAG: hypothetical protein Q4D62_16270 [Planctomycetia bacterium]|nr:hypothetical protein [Planctomycetia bacterium]